ncbi:MAG: hypothetical protein R3C12_02735 [Planctomycetaceae bacterium]|nr:hypothetical protein [Planctomycetaceae bacterium]
MTISGSILFVISATRAAGGRPALSTLLACLCGSVLLSGCRGMPVASKPATEPRNSGHPSYSALVLNYETTDFCSMIRQLRPQAVAASLSSSLHLTSAEQETKEAIHDKTGNWTQARIQIIYPHPDGSEDKGLARLIVTRNSPLEQASPEKSLNLKNTLSRTLLRASGTSPELAEQARDPQPQNVSLDEEIWQLDLAKEELDMLLSELSHRGFFEQQERPRGEAIVTVKVDEGALSKRWTSEPRLEGLMLQVYNEGELTAFHTRTSRIRPQNEPHRLGRLGS